MYHVAPLVGAWIEITVLNLFISHLLSLLSWERGLKSFPDTLFKAKEECRSSRGSVD